MEDLASHIYFASNTLARKVSKMADDLFKTYGFTSSYAFLIMAISRAENLSQKQISNGFHLAPSTVTRFVDKLVKMELLEREQQGAEVLLRLTEKGADITKRLEDELLVLNGELTDAFGEKYLDTLTKMLLHGVTLLDTES
jgi:MarR family transcriptional regulator, organic hydroperoxide resistance regulator